MLATSRSPQTTQLLGALAGNFTYCRLNNFAKVADSVYTGHSRGGGRSATDWGRLRPRAGPAAPAGPGGTFPMTSGRQTPPHSGGGPVATSAQRQGSDG